MDIGSQWEFIEMDEEEEYKYTFDVTNDYIPSCYCFEFNGL